jgi:hypothetical protein
MVTIKDIACVAYGCILGNWLRNLFNMFCHRPGSEHRFVVLAQLTTGDYVRVLETDTNSVALDFEEQIDNDTDSITGFVFDRLYPGDKAELEEIEILDSVPIEVEERDKLLNIMHEARKYW